MTLLPPTLAQSTLGEKCAVYIDQITDIPPLHLRSLRHQLNPVLTYLSNTPLGPLAKRLPFSSDDQPLALFAAVTICLFTIIVMSWRNPLRMLRRSPSYAPASNPQVSDEDFSYITPADVADPPVDDAEPDIIALRHRGTIYPLRFRAYAIDDGVLTIGDLRDAAAKSTGAGHPDCVRLLYKGKLLKNNARTCKAEGIKQHSEVLCVVSEAGAGSPSDGSDDGQPIPVTVHAPTPPQLPRPISAGEASSPPTPPSGKSKKSRNKKRNGKKSPVRPESPAPSQPPRPTSSGHSGVPGPPPNIKLMRTPLEQVTALTQWFEQEMKPICEDYIANPPSDPKKRDYEHKKLGETILAQIQIKADGIEPDGDEMARSARKALIKDTQATLNQLDAAAKL
ncbi:Ubiquitin supergroup [Penicillium robsamsonii]|uniref:Ubiquitin supergroup n=1 Tax=Penicillium robsamsonii TaxID=1792511 RepID=UPI002548F853|nr:Ubiquitin supergroup [Penicillium robsamsonii]KAJ5834471.1 Ubiquitin supergroup [Penicillium robsamsonii]